MGVHGLVASSQAVATAAGTRLLAAGGTAADAAVAVAAALAVAEPCSTGLGGDVFALYYTAATGEVTALLGAGPSPAGLDLPTATAAATAAAAAAAGAAGADRTDTPLMLPPTSPLAVTVPGAASAWAALVAAHGVLPLASALAPAIGLAEEGVVVGEVTAHQWAAAAGLLAAAPGAATTTFLPPPAAGSVWRNPDLAATLRGFAKGGPEWFYRGPVGAAIAAEVAAAGGVMTPADLSDWGGASWAPPLTSTYRGHTVVQVPMPTHGISVCLALNILDELDVDGRGGRLGEDTVPWGGGVALHAMVEAVRVAMAEAKVHVCDWNAPGKEEPPFNEGGGKDTPGEVAPPCCSPAAATAAAAAGAPADRTAELLSPEFAARCRRLFRPDSVIPAARLATSRLNVPDSDADDDGGGGGRPQKPYGETVQFVVVDAAGNACSLVNSNYMGFGTGIVPRLPAPHAAGAADAANRDSDGRNPRGVGFSLQNRGCGFELSADHANAVAPRKRPFHTIIPGLLLDPDGRLAAAYGCMGGFMQPQGHVQLLVGVLDYGLGAQAAVDAPRFCAPPPRPPPPPPPGINAYVAAGAAVPPAATAGADGGGGGGGGPRTGGVGVSDPTTAGAAVSVERGMAAAAVAHLAAVGHPVVADVGGWARGLFGKATLALRREGGVWAGGADPRSDGCASAV
ncbi:hypothetical protein MMPV_008940 [Pyropia vietnamensis]